MRITLHKPPELTLEQWLYQIANDILEKLLRKQSARDKRRRSLEQNDAGRATHAGRGAHNGRYRKRDLSG